MPDLEVRSSPSPPGGDDMQVIHQLLLRCGHHGHRLNREAHGLPTLTKTFADSELEELLLGHPLVDDYLA